jgi:hypothetical protein
MTIKEQLGSYIDTLKSDYEDYDNPPSYCGTEYYEKSRIKADMLSSIIVNLQEILDIDDTNI